MTCFLISLLLSFPTIVSSLIFFSKKPNIASWVFKSLNINLYVLFPFLNFFFLTFGYCCCFVFFLLFSFLLVCPGGFQFLIVLILLNFLGCKCKNRMTQDEESQEINCSLVIRVANLELSLIYETQPLRKRSLTMFDTISTQYAFGTPSIHINTCNLYLASWW